MRQINRREILGINFSLALGLFGGHKAIAETIDSAQTRLIKAARKQSENFVTYDPAYRQIAYPMGDVPQEYGVCSDVIIRAYRNIGIDLQQLVHEDMAKNFGLYPKTWGLKRTDKNIDHRRVPNLQVYFKRFGKSLNISNNPNDYKAGDIITCLIAGKLPHIMLVSDKSAFLAPNRLLVIHNRGSGVQENDEMFAFKITGHYRFAI